MCSRKRAGLEYIEAEQNAITSSVTCRYLSAVTCQSAIRFARHATYLWASKTQPSDIQFLLCAHARLPRWERRFRIVTSAWRVAVSLHLSLHARARSFREPSL